MLPVSLRGASTPKQSRVSRATLDCFAEPVIGPRVARTRWLAMTTSPVLPFRLTLFDECADAFLGGARHHILGHHLCRITVRVGKGHFGLPVECGLAELDGIRGFERDLLRQRNRSVALAARGDHAVDEPDVLRC